MPSLKQVADQGKRAETLVALRGLLASTLEDVEPQYVAALARQLRDVLAELDEVSAPERSAADELKAKRAARLGTASVQERTASSE